MGDFYLRQLVFVLQKLKPCSIGLAPEDSEVTFKTFKGGNGSIETNYIAVTGSHGGQGTRGRCTTVVLLNGNIFTCSMVQLYHGLRLNSKRDQERIQQ